MYTPLTTPNPTRATPRPLTVMHYPEKLSGREDLESTHRRIEETYDSKHWHCSLMAKAQNYNVSKLIYFAIPAYYEYTGWHNTRKRSTLSILAWIYAD